MQIYSERRGTAQNKSSYKTQRTMKKLLTLSTALLFTAGSAFAQSNDASISQTANSSDAAVTQTGADNSADVTQQFGQYHEATVEQVGDNNNLDLVQDNTNTFASIEQLGDGNMASIFQRSRLFVGPANIGASIELTQDGSGNVADIRQDAEAGAGGSATNMLSALQSGNDNYLFVDQNRDLGPGYNSADVEQRGDENIASVTQDGESNSVLIEQGVYGGATSSIADFTQMGNGNYFETKQVRSVGNSVVGTQTGDDNYYRASVRGEDNTVTMDMDGDANRGSWAISSLGWPHQPTGNTLSIDVEGSDNYSTGSIAGDYNTVSVVQEGLGNRLGTSWYTTDGVSISGDLNSASVMQTSDFNTASVSIAGNSNTATITQN